MKRKTGKLSEREKNFCIFYSYYGNAYEAAAHAGFRQPEKTGLKMLARNDICREIDRVAERKHKKGSLSAAFGYERLAFGGVEDAVRLMFSSDPAAELEKGCCLFNVAEIKRPKNDALEIKFFDRIKALEKLEAQRNEGGGASDFYKAVIGGIRDASGDGGQEEL